MIYLRASVLDFSLGEFTSSSWFSVSSWICLSGLYPSVCLAISAGSLNFSPYTFLVSHVSFSCRISCYSPSFLSLRVEGQEQATKSLSSICPFEESTFCFLYVICWVCSVFHQFPHYSVFSILSFCTPSFSVGVFVEREHSLGSCVYKASFLLKHGCVSRTSALRRSPPLAGSLGSRGGNPHRMLRPHLGLTPLYFRLRVELRTL